MAVDHHHRAALGGEAPAGIFLQAGVDRQLDRIAGCVGPRRQFAHDLAACGDFHPLGAGLAGQMLVIGALQPVLADLEARRDEQRILALLIVFRGRRADIAEQMADRGTGGIMARKALARRDAGQVGQADGNGGELVIGQLVGDLDRTEAGRLVQFLLDPIDIVGLEREELRQMAHRRLGIDDPLRDQVDAEIGAVIGQRPAVAIDNPAAPGRDQRQVDAIAFRQELIFLILGNADPAHAANQQCADRALEPADHHGPAAEGETLGGFGDDLALGRREFHAITRQRSIRAHCRTTKGKSNIVQSIWGATSNSFTGPPPVIRAKKTPPARQKIIAMVAINQS